MAAYITAHDYKDALKILREQKKLGDNKVSYFKKLYEVSVKDIDHEAYQLIGEYLAYCGGSGGIDDTFLRIKELVLELQKRN